MEGNEKFKPDRPLNLLTIEEAAGELKMSRQYVYTLVRQGSIPAYRVAGSDTPRIAREDLIGVLEPYTPRRSSRAGGSEENQDESTEG